MRLSWVLAIKYLNAKSGRWLCSALSILSVSGIALSVAILISVMAVMNGFSSKLLRDVLGMNGHVVVHCHRDAIDEIANLLRVADINAMLTPVIEGQVILKARRGTAGAVLRGLPTTVLKDRLSSYLASINFDNDLENGIYLGSRLAENLSLNCGDEITVLSAGDLFTWGSNLSYVKKFKVLGIFHLGILDYDSTFAFMHIDSAEGLFTHGDYVQFVELKLNENEVSLSSDVAKMIAEETRFAVDDWKVVHGHYFRALELERNAMFFILTLMLLVATLNIVSGISLLVQNKSRTIAMLRSMGMSKFAIAGIFCICGLTLGTLGTLLGCFVGTLFALNLGKIGDLFGGFEKDAFLDSIAYCLDGIQTKSVLFDAGCIAAMALGISLLAALPPAILASRRDPVDILKYE